MLRGVKRCRLLQTAAVGSLCLVLWHSNAFAQDKKYDFELPQQPLSDSLKEYARVSGQQIIFTEDLVWGYVGKTLHGTLTATEALDQLLQGTGLFVEHTTAGAVMIRRERRAGESSTDTADATASHPVGDMPEQVVVTGLIYSLQTNLDIKRKAG